MKRPALFRGAAALAAIVCAILMSIAPAGASSDASDSSGTPTARARPGKVLIVTLPRLTWADVQRIRPPQLSAFFGKAALAACSPRAAGSMTRPGDAYLTIGAGNRMGTVLPDDGEVVDRREQLVIGDPSAIYRRTTGMKARWPIVALGKPAIDRYNDTEQYFGAKAGALAEALSDHRRTMGVIANADQAFAAPADRHAALAAMDESGQVHDGLVSTELLRADDGASFGLATDPEVLESTFRGMWQTDDVVLVEFSDLERAEMARSSATEAEGARQFDGAVRSADKMFGRLLDSVDLASDTVIVLGPTPPAVESQLTVFAMAGAGTKAGWASSGTTRRDGYTTLTDIAPTILDHFDIKVPDSMSDTPLTSTASNDSLTSRVTSLIDRSDRALVRDHVFGPVTVVFIVAIVLDIALAVLCLARFPALAPWVRGLALVVLATPPVTFLLGLVPFGSAGALGAAVALGALVIAAISSIVSRRGPGLTPLIPIALLWLVLAVDIAFGGSLQINTIFGYSPIVAGRFAGFGNQAFSMIAICALLLGAAAVERRTPAGQRAALATVAAAAVWFLVTIVLDGLPSMGSDVGGVLALVPAATVALLMFRGVRIRVRLAAMIGAGTVAVLALFAGIDLARPADERTHLGRFVSKLFAGDAGEIIQRKIAANLRVLTSAWTWIIPVALIYFMYLTWRPNRTLQRLNQMHPQFRAFGVSALTLGTLAMLLNDSGVSMPAMMVGLVAAFVSYHVVRLGPAPAEAEA